jgi:four helix bundle protein
MTGSRRATIRSHRDLEVWQTAISLIQDTYRLTDSFPKQEMYGLMSQMRRSSISIAANIAEGYARDSTRDYLRFLAIASGSVRELDTYFTVCVKLEFVTGQDVEKLEALANSVGRMLTNLRAALRRRVL